MKIWAIKLLLSALIILCPISFSWGFLTREHPTHQEIVQKGMDLKKDVHNGDSHGEAFID